VELRLGINTCFAVKRWPQPANWGPIVRDSLGLRLVQHTLDLVDLSASAEVERQAEAVRRTAGYLGLEVASTFTGLAAYSSNLLLAPDAEARAAARAWYTAAIGFTSAIGAGITGGHVGAFSVQDWSDPSARNERWTDLKGTLAALALTAAESGLQALVVENLASAREPSTRAMIADLLTDGDDGQVPIRLCLDVGHMCVAGTGGEERDPYAWLRQFGSRAPIVQLQQSDAAGDHHWPFTPAHDAEGRIAPERVIAALAESGATHTDLILEVIPPFEQADNEVLDDLVVSVERWRNALAASGYST
jgi:sugar phosphate isomerase/epimerase